MLARVKMINLYTKLAITRLVTEIICKLFFLCSVFSGSADLTVQAKMTHINSYQCCNSNENLEAYTQNIL